MCRVCGRKSKFAPDTDLRLPGAAGVQRLVAALGQGVVQRHEGSLSALGVKISAYRSSIGPMI